MHGEGNTGSNPTPARAVLEMMRTVHGIGWHRRGGWCRKFKGDPNRTYFGRVPAAEAVRLKVLEDDRREGNRQLEQRPSTIKVRDAANRFLINLDHQLETGKIRDAQRASYGDEIDRFIRFVGINRRLSDFCLMTAPDDLFKPLRAAAIARGIFAAEKHIVQVRTFLDWCSSKRRLIPAPNYADAFDPPGAKEKRAARKAVRRDKGIAFWQPAEVLEVVAAARADGVHRYAQVLLMLNGGMGATDLSNLEDADMDWPRRCIHTDRSKTLVPRVVPLWDITLEAMRVSRAARATPADARWSGRFFLTKHGRPLVLETLDVDAGKRRKVKRTDSVKNWFYTLINGKPRAKWKTKAARLPHLKRHGAGAYTLRSVFVTLSMGHGQDANLEAIILGQQFASNVREFYVRDEQFEKLRGVVDHVRRQIWPDQ